MAEDHQDIALGFRHLTVKTDSKVLLNDISGYVRKGCITAVMGPSASGKSLLMQSLSGRVQDLTITGEVTINGAIANPKAIDNPIAYVPQEDSLIGELTAREMTRNTALLKRNESADKLEKDVQNLLEKLGLSSVADGIIGTLLFRGLSGGQKKRVEISAELIASPSILLIDEPTSGLDAKIAYDVINLLRELVKASKGDLSVVLSIHQPNSRILELFDHWMLIDKGQLLFFGTLEESMTHFASIGYNCPKLVTPTDFFMQVTDTSFEYGDNFDFVSAFSKSNYYAALDHALINNKQDTKSVARVSRTDTVPLMRKLYVLMYREFALAFRDPTLYYFQLAMMVIFSCLSGAVFFQVPQKIETDTANVFSGAVTWLTFLNSWIHIFKVYHINRNDRRAEHEVANNKYSPLVFFMSDSLSIALLLLFFNAVPPIAYFMCGFPRSGYPFMILNFWVTCLASEAMLSFICKFSKVATTSMIISQIAFVTLTVFTGGVFIPWKDCPDYWIWLQETAVFVQSSRAALMDILAEIKLRCDTVIGHQCSDPGSGLLYDCIDSTVQGNKCLVEGREMLNVTQGVGTEDNYWYYFVYLCAILLFYKTVTLLMLLFPWERQRYFLTTQWRKIIGNHQAGTDSNNEISSPSPSAAEDIEYHPVPTAKPQQSDSIRFISSIEQVNQTPEASITVSQAGLAWSNVSVTLPSGKKLIDNVSGFVPSGRILALMGPSGAGKTTLLNALARRASYADVKGRVMFAGREMTPLDLTYVPQFDAVNGMLTVSEHFKLVGNLTGTDVKQMEEREKLLLQALGLTDKKDTLVKFLTGGEVKRVCVGVGMMSKPNVLFLDEPTTGLDSTAAFSIVRYLSSVSRATQVAVIMTIHQPSALVFRMVDDLLLLENGKIAFGGTVSTAKSYFASIGCANPEHINYADYYLDLVQASPPNTSKSWTELFESSPEFGVFESGINGILHSKEIIPCPTSPSGFSRFRTMFSYFMVYFWREKGIYGNRLLYLVLNAVFTGTLYLNLQTYTDQITSYNGALFYSQIAVLLCPVASTPIFAKDRREALDRVKNGIYSPGMFVFCQALAGAVYTLFITFVYVCIFHWVSNLNPNSESFIYNWFTTWLHIVLMDGLIGIVIEVLKNDFLCTTAGMLSIGSLMMMSGFFRQTTRMPKWIFWLSYMLPLKWSFNGLVWQVFHTQDFTIPDVDDDTVNSVSGESILSNVFELRDVPSWGLFGAVIGYAILFRFGHYILFAFQTGNVKLTFGHKSKADHAAAKGVGSREVMPVDEEDGLEMMKSGV
eukprot:gene27142-32787_t